MSVADMHLRDISRPGDGPRVTNDERLLVLKEAVYDLQNDVITVEDLVKIVERATEHIR